MYSTALPGIHIVAGIKYFAKPEFKSAIKQKQLDKIFKEVNMINFQIVFFFFFSEVILCIHLVEIVSYIFPWTMETYKLLIIDNMIIYQDDICIDDSKKKSLLKTDSVLNKWKNAERDSPRRCG